MGRIVISRWILKISKEEWWFRFLCVLGCIGWIESVAAKTDERENTSPRIVNIVCFIRQTDYRLKDADAHLFEAVRRQINLFRAYDLPATFLLEYDALVNPLYPELLKKELDDRSEIGAWWEITQPQAEAAGIKWRGEHPWVSHANIAFSTGYTLEEREKLTDVYMAKFKEIFGTYPKSVGSWFIDAHTLVYMYEKYHIVASCNCKDQRGTDGYTLWGGYWNQAYYPSRVNGYMPAQTSEAQIPVPVFRMLGSDPIYQYDDGLGRERQGVISLEPVYPESGADPKWVDYFLESLVNQPCLAFNYAQAGQENSFTWPAMQAGLEMQMPLLESLREEGKVRIETLGRSGEWFKKTFAVTPATAVTALTDVREQGNRTVWFNSRYYRANLLWEKQGFRFRDFHLFDERYASAYFDKAGKGNQFLFYTLPVVDGFGWSRADDRAGLRVMRLDEKGNKQKELVLGNPVVVEMNSDQLKQTPSSMETGRDGTQASCSAPKTGNNVLSVACDDGEGNSFQFIFKEDCFELVAHSPSPAFRWALELTAPDPSDLPFTTIGNQAVDAVFDGFAYRIVCRKGKAEATARAKSVFRLIPSDNRLVIDCTNGRKK